MYPVLGHLWGWPVSTYSVLMILAAGIFLLCLWRILAPDVRRPLDWLLRGWPLFAVAILGARLAYAVAHVDYFSEQPLQLFLPWSEGLSFHGGLMAGLLGIALLPRRWLPEPSGGAATRPQAEASWRWQIADAAAWGLSAAATLGWVALLSVGGAWGRSVELRSAPGVLVLPDLYGLAAPRYPVQILGLAQALVVVWLLWLLRRPAARYPGLWLALYGILYLGGQFIIDFLRADPAPAWGELRATQWLDAAGALLGAAWLISLFARRTPRVEKGVDLDTKGSM